jgi:hypothetical protein
MNKHQYLIELQPCHIILQNMVPTANSNEYEGISTQTPYKNGPQEGVFNFSNCHLFVLVSEI